MRTRAARLDNAIYGGEGKISPEITTLMSAQSDPHDSCINYVQSDDLGGAETKLLDMVRHKNREFEEEAQDKTLDLPQDDISDELAPLVMPGLQKVSPPQNEELPRWSIRRSICPVCSQKWRDKSSIYNVKSSGLKRYSSADLPSVIAPARLRASITMAYVPRPALAAVDESVGVGRAMRNTSASWQLTRARRFRIPKPQMPSPEAIAPPISTAPMARKDLDIRVNRFGSGNGKAARIMWRPIPMTAERKININLITIVLHKTKSVLHKTYFLRVKTKCYFTRLPSKNPSTVLKLEKCKLPDLGPKDVLVRMLAAPVNPADINTIQGKYPIKLKLPCIPGNEGVGIVEKVGSEVKKLCQGNKVILTMPTQGTWRTLAVFSSFALTAVPDALRVPEAATLAVNPCTSFRLLSDFIPVRGTDLIVIQNGANSSCGQNIIQLCKVWGVQNINIVRNRPEIDDLKKQLLSLGATHVLTEEEAKVTSLFKNKEIENPSLGLNCVGGQSSLLIAKYLKHSGCMVTYGGMSKKPVTIPTSAFIFKNVRFRGFWMTDWNKRARNSAARDGMLSEIIQLMLKNKLKAPTHKLIKFENYLEAIENTLTSKGFRKHKYILDFR
ncbi:unnamed protein product [Spodoptera exigua]|nr:unnamed protein product [Spodoptera exigua]